MVFWVGGYDHHHAQHTIDRISDPLQRWQVVLVVLNQQLDHQTQKRLALADQPIEQGDLSRQKQQVYLFLGAFQRRDRNVGKSDTRFDEVLGFSIMLGFTKGVAASSQLQSRRY